MPFILPPLYPILDAVALPDGPVERERLLRSIIAALNAAGVAILQYRNKQGSDAQMLSDCAILRDAAGVKTGMAAQQITLVLNDRPALVAEARFDGVHVGQGDASPAEARAMVGRGRIVGVSTHNEAQLRAADATTADYIAIGPVFATTSKQNPDRVVGLEGVRRARALTSKPLVAIGGITLANCQSVRHAGADSVALISALFGTGHRGLNALPGESETAAIGKTARDFLRELR